jgi:hypothetical protein
MTAAHCLSPTLALLALFVSLTVKSGTEMGASSGSCVGEPALVLGKAFERRYRCDTRMTLDLRVTNGFGEVMRRKARAANKWISGRIHGLARFTYPPALRGMALLTIENEKRDDDLFLFLPSLGRVRRISSARRGDSFLGTDLWYEDFERRQVGDYEFESFRPTDGKEEPLYTISARPRFEAGYDRVEFRIAVADLAILDTLYFKHPEEEPFKIIRTPRSGLRQFEGCLLPTRVVARDSRRGTETEVRIEELAVNSPLDDSLFSIASLESGRPIPE